MYISLLNQLRKAGGTYLSYMQFRPPAFSKKHKTHYNTLENRQLYIFHSGLRCIVHGFETCECCCGKIFFDLDFVELWLYFCLLCLIDNKKILLLHHNKRRKSGCFQKNYYLCKK